MPTFISPNEMKSIFEEKKTSAMYKMITKSNPDNILPSSFGKKWLSEENDKLLIELQEGLTFNEIAKRHERSIGGILSRCKENAFQMYLKKISIKEIEQKVKLSEEEIREIINKKEKNKIRKEETKETKQEQDIKEIKEDIIEIKKSLKELIEMIKAIYDFEED